MKRNRVFVVVEGGNISGVFSRAPIDVTIIDYDVEGIPEDELVQSAVQIREDWAFVRSENVAWPVEVADLEKTLSAAGYE